MLHSPTTRLARRTLLLAAGLAVSMLAAAAGAPPPAAPSFATPRLAAADFSLLHASVRPRGERWATIPWQTDLAAARVKAASENKPLLMWIMDGHPLGCT